MEEQWRERNRAEITVTCKCPRRASVKSAHESREETEIATPERDVARPRSQFR